MSSQLKRTQRRGIRFPMYPLERALNVAQVVLENGGGTLSLDVTAQSLRLSVKGSGFKTRVASAKHYGLITSKMKILEITKLASKILRPVSQDEYADGLKESFFHSKLFKDIYERYENNYLPNKEILENILVRTYGVSDVSKEIAYKSFFNSAEFAGLITERENGSFCGIIKADEDIDSDDENGGDVVSKLGLNELLVEFLDKIGSLRMIIRLYSYSLEDKKDEIKNIFRDTINRALEIATELNLPALKMSLKIISDSIDKVPFENIEQFIIYIDDGLKEDIKLK